MVLIDKLYMHECFSMIDEWWVVFFSLLLLPETVSSAHLWALRPAASPSLFLSTFVIGLGLVGLRSSLGCHFPLGSPFLHGSAAY